jgi:outer membrane protein OmpA-like peptidoglycan-associated protein
MIKQTWNISEDEKNRILNLHESATKRMYLSEQEKEEEIDDSFYKLGSEFYFKINQNYLYSLADSTDGQQWTYVNGNVYNLKVNYKTKKLVSDSGWVLNFELTDKYWPDLYSSSVGGERLVPLQNANMDYKFVAMAPNDRRLPSPTDKSKIGSPTLFTAKIVSMDITLLEGRYEESEDDTISPVMYVKKGNKGILIQLFPGASAKYFPNKPTPETPETPEDTPTDVPFELNITSPFKFNMTDLTDEAKQEFKDFIESVKENYANVQGDVEVICSASIDGPPDQKRIDYDMNLSKRRAEAIVSILKTSLPGTKLNFIPKGIGQTDQFAKGKKYPNVKDENQTAPNRRLIIKLPQIMKKGS